MTGYFSFTELMVTQKIQGIINLVQMSSGLFKVLRWGNAITTGYDSFTGDTLVWTENGTIAISEVAIGDEVYAYDAETGEAILAKVTDISVSEIDELVHLTINGELIRTTASHPFYTASGEWKAAGDLMVGDRVVTMTGEVTVEATEVEKLSEAVTVYNLTVEGAHNYYVAENGILVHNGCNGKSATDAEAAGYYQDSTGKWHRPNGEFASNVEVGLPAPSTGTSNGVHGNSLANQNTNYGYVLVDKDTNEILKFGETLYPDTRLTIKSQVLK